jgi:hypothetical protein
MWLVTRGEFKQGLSESRGMQSVHAANREFQLDGGAGNS